MRHFRIALIVMVSVLACNRETPSERLGVEGASCTKTADCESPLQCLGGICADINKDVKPDTSWIFADTGRTDEDLQIPDVTTETVEIVTGCQSDGDCALPTPKCITATGDCVQCVTKADCDNGWNCSMNQCVEGVCVPDQQWCEGGSAYKCNDEGDGYEYSTPCGDGVCVAGECKNCEPGKTKCEDGKVMECNDAGESWVQKEQCQGELGCVDGICLACYPGDKECQNGDSYECKQDGSGWELDEDCTGKCSGGLCLSPCGGPDPKLSNIGCDYWAVDLDNAVETDPLGTTFDAENQPYSVVVSNTSKDTEAIVTISNATGQVKNGSVPPNGLYAFDLPSANVAGSLKQKLAYRIQSTVPIVAYQFNPSTNTGVFSNDASLLLPSHALGKEYFVVSHPQDDPNFRGFVTVVGVEDGETKVTVKTTGSVAPGNGVPGLVAGNDTEFILQQFEVLNLSTGAMGQDLTGTHISADKKVSVFGGSECGGSPVTNVCVNGTCPHYPQWSCTTDAQCPATCCCDHMEQQMIPVNAWGTTYAVGHSQFRGNESDTFVVLASQPETTATTNPDVATIPTLGPGQSYKFETKQNFELTASKPVLIVQFLSGEHAPTPNPDQCMMGICLSSMAMCQSEQDCGPSALPVTGDAQTGDPSMILLPAVQQWRSDYLFLVPQFYKGGNYVTLVYPQGADVQLDGSPVTNGSTFAEQVYTANIVSVSSGIHTVTADEPVSVMVHGYDQYVSFGYSAGMNLDLLQ